MPLLHDNILSTIGNTPIVELSQISPKHVRLFGKIEAFNPGGSVKDRLALAIIEDAERSGRLVPGQTVIEATSGNTGIGLALVCAAKGYPLVIVMAESFSVERRRLMRFLGAKVILTPAAEKGTGMINKARELADTHGWFLCRQFENEANADVHSNTTAQEIIDAFSGVRLDYWISGFGTGGTLKGVARRLREASPTTKIIAAEPDNSPLLASGYRQATDEEGSPIESHPAFRPHLMQGWTPDFISKLAGDAIDANYIDKIISVSGVDALANAKALARQTGIFAGTSAGATIAAAMTVAENAPEGSHILCMLPDTGERYMSTPLFEDIPSDMTEDELEISNSSPSARFGASAPSKPSKPAPAIEEDPSAANYVDTAVNDKITPVTMFALEWCEFCWAARRLFSTLGVTYRSIDLDSVEMQQSDFGGKIRNVLKIRTGASTIPQIYVGGALVGGCSELIDACNNGRLSELLNEAGISHKPIDNLDAKSFLPKWVHPRVG